ncbi:uncharacterized protein A4U43_C05F19970 [Asparagus officinalis]|uniref:Uncharacterized protein n=1 Tax=Asparagus officinalis TaxID=4686 RepID=A0A5P1EYC4_ASPOF|nr:uncharacterized protein A4U43_C05F19970 [Asparagus officinalis]
MQTHRQIQAHLLEPLERLRRSDRIIQRLDRALAGGRCFAARSVSKSGPRSRRCTQSPPQSVGGGRATPSRACSAGVDGELLFLNVDDVEGEGVFLGPGDDRFLGFWGFDCWDWGRIWGFELEGTVISSGGASVGVTRPGIATEIVGFR